MISLACLLCSPHNSEVPPRRDRGCQNTCLCIPHAYVYWSPLSREQWRLALSKREKKLLRLHSWGQRSDWLLGRAVSYCTDQLLKPYFSSTSTLNGTPGGDRWARIIGGQIGWLSESLHRFDADCSGSSNLKMQAHGKHEKNSPHRKHTTKTTSAKRPRPLRDGARKTTSHALAHAHPLP